MKNAAPTAIAAAVIVFAHLGGGGQWMISSYGLQREVPDSLRGRMFAADFGLVVSAHDEPLWPEVESAVITAARDTGVTVQYSNDIDRWSSVTIPPTRRRSRPHRRFGRLSVHVLDPACWAVYKLARYLDADVEDLRYVLRRAHVPSGALARLCGTSLRASPRSTEPAWCTCRRSRQITPR